MFVCNTPRPTQLSISVRSHSGPARAYALQLGLYLYLEETYKKFGIYRQNLVPFLNRLDDAVPPESNTAREFGGIAKRIASGEATPNDWQRARQWLVLWRDNDAKLQPLLKRSYLTQDLAPVSENLSRAAEIGLQALDDLEKNRAVNADVRQLSIDFLKSAAKPQAVLLLMVAPSVELLINSNLKRYWTKMSA
jgi:hypothetical protein